LVVVVHR
jgi:hypothetical protein